MTFGSRSSAIRHCSSEYSSRKPTLWPDRTRYIGRHCLTRARTLLVSTRPSIFRPDKLINRPYVPLLSGHVLGPFPVLLLLSSATLVYRPQLNSPRLCFHAPSVHRLLICSSQRHLNGGPICTVALDLDTEGSFTYSRGGFPQDSQSQAWFGPQYVLICSVA